MWTVNDCDASKKKKAFKNSDNGKLRGGGGAREGVGRERKGVKGPTPTDLLADRSDGRSRGRSRVRALMSSEIQKMKCGLRWVEVG